MNFWDIGVLFTTKDQVIISSHTEQQRSNGVEMSYSGFREE